MQARLPRLGRSIVLPAVGDDSERRADLLDLLLDDVTRVSHSGPDGVRDRFQNSA
ncbi:hypothetical protein [Nonomuraea candida]|uniref:hypothetical protein n=1 Tax=Nonomuraea candida TaxID=359159 RepID=UPI000A71E8EE|nr:hypothetical protein [Nonomuraea candida]